MVQVAKKVSKSNVSKSIFNSASNNIRLDEQEFSKIIMLKGKGKGLKKIVVTSFLNGPFGKIQNYLL